MFEKEILRDTYNDQRINRIHMYANETGTGLFYDANCIHVVPYDELVNAVKNGFAALKKDGSVYSPGKYTLTDNDVTIDFGDSIVITVAGPQPDVQEPVEPEVTLPEEPQDPEETDPEETDPDPTDDQEPTE